MQQTQKKPTPLSTGDSIFFSFLSRPSSCSVRPSRFNTVEKKAENVREEGEDLIAKGKSKYYDVKNDMKNEIKDVKSDVKSPLY